MVENTMIVDIPAFLAVNSTSPVNRKGHKKRHEIAEE